MAVALGISPGPTLRLGVASRSTGAHDVLHHRRPLAQSLRFCRFAGSALAAAQASLTEREGPSAAESAAAPPQSAESASGPQLPGQTRARRDVTVPVAALRRGAVFRGTVTSVQKFGAFVDFGAFADGLVHVSKLSSAAFRSASDVVSEGQQVTVSLIKLERSSGRITLSMLESDALSFRPTGGERSHDANARAPLSTSTKFPSPARNSTASPSSPRSRDESESPFFHSRIWHRPLSADGGRDGASSSPSASTQGNAREGERFRVQPGWSGHSAGSKQAGDRVGSFRPRAATDRGRARLGSDAELHGRERSGRSRDASAKRESRVDGFSAERATGVANRVRIPGMGGVQRGNAEGLGVPHNESRSRMRDWYECECCY